MQNTALVTGASGGIGEALAEEHARAGGDLVLVARSADRLKAVGARLSQTYGIESQILVEDLTDPEAPHRIIAKLDQQALEIEVLINNAGFGHVGDLIATAASRQTAMVDLNVRALVELTTLLMPTMARRGRGYILNVASVAAFMPGPSMAVYYASKHFVHAFSQAIAVEGRSHGVVVTSLCPGPTRSGFQQASGMDATPIDRLPLPTAASVARAGYRGLRRGRRVVVPGFSNKLLRVLAWLLPDAVLMRGVRTMHKAH